MSRFLENSKRQMREIYAELHTKEFWIYLVLILLFVFLFFIIVRMAVNFDFVTRSQLRSAFSCKTGEGQMATIIVGGIVFVLLCVFSLGQVIEWGEENKQLRVRGRKGYSPIPIWKPIAYVVGTVIVGVVGYSLLTSWCM